MLRSIATLLVLVAPALLGCSAPEALGQVRAAAPIPVKLATVREEPLEAVYRTGGTVRGRTTAVVTSKTTGYPKDMVS